MFAALWLAACATNQTSEQEPRSTPEKAPSAGGIDCIKLDLTAMSTLDQAVGEEVFAQAEEQYKRGDFEAAAASYKQAFLMLGQPVLFFNMGQSYRLAGRAQEAIVSYQTFLCMADPKKYQAAFEQAQQFLEELQRPAKSTSR